MGIVTRHMTRVTFAQIELQVNAMLCKRTSTGDGYESTTSLLF
jgi:hypothetical protein